MVTFKEYLIEYSGMTAPNFNEPEEGKNDVSMHNDEELIDWVLNDEELYNAARSAMSFDDLMQDIDTLFIYNNDQYNALARAFRMGDLRDEQQEEEEQQVSANYDEYGFNVHQSPRSNHKEIELPQRAAAEEEEALTASQQADKDERREKLIKAYKAIFQSGPNPSNPWAAPKGTYTRTPWKKKEEEEEETTRPNPKVKLRVGFDFNGNKILSIKAAGGGGFSIQTNGNLPATHRMDTQTLDYDIALRELTDYVNNYGTKRQKTIMDKFAPEEEEETKAPGRRDQARAIRNSSIATPRQTNNPKRLNQQANRLVRRLGGGKSTVDI